MDAKAQAKLAIKGFMKGLEKTGIVKPGHSALVDLLFEVKFEKARPATTKQILDVLDYKGGETYSVVGDLDGKFVRLLVQTQDAGMVPASLTSEALDGAA